MNKHYEKIESLGAFREGLQWLEGKDDNWYNECERGDWLACLVAKLFDRKAVCLALCEIVETVLHLVPEVEERPRIAIETTRKWCIGDATLDEVKDAVYDAYAAASDNSSYALIAAYAASETAYTSDAVAATHVSDAAHFSACATGSTQSLLLKYADIIRSHFPWVVVREKLENED